MMLTGPNQSRSMKREREDPDQDDDVVDIDDENGDVRLAKRRTLRREAKTKDHLLTHRFTRIHIASHA